MKKIISSLTTIALLLSLSITSFAEEGVRYSNELTSSPLRIFFAVLVIVLFVISEIVFEKIRKKRVAKRNEKSRNK